MGDELNRWFEEMSEEYRTITLQHLTKVRSIGVSWLSLFTEFDPL